MSAQEWMDRTQEITEKATGGAWEWAPSITTQSRYRPAKVSTLVWDGGDAVEATLPHSTADAEFIAHARTALPQAVAALQAVTDLHQPRSRVTRSASGHLVDTPGPCTDCDWDWPCPTITAVTEALGEECAAMRAELAEGKAAN